MVDISAKETGHRWGGEEEDLLATIVATCKTGLTLVADDIGFDGNAIARLEVCDRRVDCEDCSCGFVTEDVIICNYHGPNATSVPEVDIRSVQKVSSVSICLRFCILRLAHSIIHALVAQGPRIKKWKMQSVYEKSATHPQMPVLLIAMVTSPSFNPSPCWTVSRLGSAEPIHNL